jgi:hypothetical protein
MHRFAPHALTLGSGTETISDGQWTLVSLLTSALSPFSWALPWDYETQLSWNGQPGGREELTRLRPIQRSSVTDEFARIEEGTLCECGFEHNWRGV